MKEHKIDVAECCRRTLKMLSTIANDILEHAIGCQCRNKLCYLLPAGALYEGFQGRVFEFCNFERKFEVRLFCFL